MLPQVFTPEKKEADWVKIRSITEQNDLDGEQLLRQTVPSELRY